MWEDAALTSEEKAACGEEVLFQLPHSHLVPTIQATLAAAQKSIRTRLDSLEKTSVASTETGRSKGPKVPTGKKSLRETESNA